MRLHPKMLSMALLLAMGCSESTDPGQPTMEDVSGSYEATTFTVEEDGATRDLLAEGASIQVTLASDGTTTGRIFVPEGGEEGQDFDADLVGTWSLLGTTVTFDHDADTFLRDMQFTYTTGRLSASATFGGATIVTVLAR